MEEPQRPVEERQTAQGGFQIAGVSVREDDIESTRIIRVIAFLFRGMAGLLLLLMIGQVISGLTGTVVLSVGVLLAEAVRLIIGAGLLWGVGDLAVLAVKSHYDLRATRILAARVEYLMRSAQARAADAPEGNRFNRER